MGGGAPLIDVGCGAYFGLAQGTPVCSVGRYFGNVCTRSVFLPAESARVSLSCQNVFFFSIPKIRN